MHWRNLLVLRRAPLLSLALALSAGFGCDDDAVCPAGTAGDPCRFTVGIGSAPSIPQGLDVVVNRDSSDAALEVDDDSAEPDDTGATPPDDADTVPPSETDSEDDDATEDSSSADPQTPNSMPLACS